VSLDPALAAHAMAAVGQAIVTLDHGGNVTSWNRAAEQPPGFSRDDAVEHGFALIIPAEYRARHVAVPVAMDSDHLAHDGAVARVEAVTASRGWIVLGLHVGLLAGEDGPPSGAAGVLRPPGDVAVEFVTPEEGKT
jgi:PAS domain S-box-containing protein